MEGGKRPRASLSLPSEGERRTQNTNRGYGPDADGALPSGIVVKGGGLGETRAIESLLGDALRPGVAAGLLRRIHE